MKVKLNKEMLKMDKKVFLIKICNQEFSLKIKIKKKINIKSKIKNKMTKNIL